MVRENSTLSLECHKHDNFNTHHWHITHIIWALGKYFSTFLKTKGYCIRMPWRFVSCVTTDLRNAHCSRELGGLVVEMQRFSNPPLRQHVCKEFLYYKVPFSNTAQDPFPSLSSSYDWWFQGYLWWHQLVAHLSSAGSPPLHGISFKFLFFALQIWGAGLSKTGSDTLGFK